MQPCPHFCPQNVHLAAALQAGIPSNFSTMFSNSQHPEWGATESQGVRNTDNRRLPYVHPYAELRLVRTIEKFLCLFKTWYSDSFLRKRSRTHAFGLVGFLFWFGFLVIFKTQLEVVPTPTFNIRYVATLQFEDSGSSFSQQTVQFTLPTW